MTRVYYNDNEPYVTQWLRNLSENGLITPGVVDDRPIQEVSTGLESYKRCHFFAGIGGWDLALQLAGWPVDEPVWTGSCPCQPFSVAGKRAGVKDERHLWPIWYRLISEYKPPTIFGEQVASADGRKWLAGVFADLEKLGYAVAGADLCAASVGAPHIRQRLYWVGYTDGGLAGDGYIQPSGQHGLVSQDGGVGGGLAISKSEQFNRRGTERFGRPEPPDSSGLEQSESEQMGLSGQSRIERDAVDFWSACQLIPCADNKQRRVESESFPLVNGSAFKLGSGSSFSGKSRSGMLKGYGNAIVSPLAAEFIKAFLEVRCA